MFHLRVIYDGAHDGAFNMAVDEFLFRRQIQRNDQNPILRFYRFSEPVLTVGYGMWRSVHSSPSPLPSGERDRVRGENAINGPMPIRRITGGGVVRHGSDLTYSIVVPLTEYQSLGKAKESYQLIHAALQDALNRFGVGAQLFGGDRSVRLVGQPEVKPKYLRAAQILRFAQNDRTLFCFDSPAPFDVMLGERKIAGAGQKRSMGFLLHQGSIAWDILSKNHPYLEPERFVRQFSSCLAGLFRLPIKEIPLHGEETQKMKESSVA